MTRLAPAPPARRYSAPARDQDLRDPARDRDPERTCRRWPVAAVPAAVMLALGTWGITRQGSMWRDEAATWQVSHRSLAEILRLLHEVDLVHGLYYVIVHALFAVFGDSLWTLRLPSVLAMTAAAALTARLGARLAGPRAGLAAGLAFALLPSVQQYAQEGRPYALVVAGAALATRLLVTALDRPGRARWAGYAATVLITAHLNWLSLLVLPAHAATVLLVRPGRRLLRQWTLAALAALAGAAPLIAASRSQAFQVSWIRPLQWPTVLGVGLLVGVGCLCAAVARRPGRRGSSVVPLALPLLAVPQLALVLASLVQPIYLPRYVLYTSVALALLIGAAVDTAVRAAGARWRRVRPWVLVAGAGVCAFVALLPVERQLRQPQSRVDDVLAAADRVARVADPGDAVLFIPAARRDTALVSPGKFSGLRDLVLTQRPAPSGTLKGYEASPRGIREAMLAVPRIVVVSDAPAVASRTAPERERTKTAVLREYFEPLSDAEVNGRRVTVYGRR
ncbi:glycosyltransferase family 39 protein [Streptomyces gamaensis]|uniref:Glycosyltransferase family 39 protein n=1 Tax=Streptomyces gamaensis TaxID=1763542 RepID=A0ABW0ZAZ3_9ACTN